MKKVIVAMMLMAMTATTVAGCGSSMIQQQIPQLRPQQRTPRQILLMQQRIPQTTLQQQVQSGAISVLSREDGSGTRGAFIELFGIEQKDADGNKVDNTIDSAEITNSTSVMMTTVAGNKAAIGYVSLGSLDESQVKAVLIDGAEATAENVKERNIQSIPSVQHRNQR